MSQDLKYSSPCELCIFCFSQIYKGRLDKNALVLQRINIKESGVSNAQWQQARRVIIHLTVKTASWTGGWVEEEREWRRGERISTCRVFMLPIKILSKRHGWVLTKFIPVTLLYLRFCHWPTLHKNIHFFPAMLAFLLTYFY